MDLMLAMVGAALVAGTAALAEPLPQPQRLSFNCSADGSRWPYLVQEPEGEAKAILIYLHGHYSDENQGMAEGTYNDAFGKLRRECLARGWVYVCAWYGGNTWMGPLAEQGLVDLVGILRERWPGCPVFLSGGSMGGSSTLVFAVRRPDLLDGAIARCPAGDIQSYYTFAAGSDNPTLRNIAAAIRIHYTADGHGLAEELKARSAAQNVERLRFGVHIVHGARDTLIAPEGARRLVERARELGKSVEYVELAEGDHDAPVTQVGWTEALDYVWAHLPGQ